MTPLDPLYVLARRVLLDALEALGIHRDAIILVGAQAVYLRVGEGELTGVAPYTTDGDLAIDPAVLANTPPIERALLDAGFTPKSRDSVGIWVTTRNTTDSSRATVAIDLLVPSSVSPGSGRRSARLPGHDSHAARIVQGLDGAIVDADIMTIPSLESTDPRTFDIRVAGPAALLVAKVHKINDRKDTDRRSDKDAVDVFRLLQGSQTEDLSSRFKKLLADHRSANAASAARLLFQAQFGSPTGAGVVMAVRNTKGLVDEDELTASCVTLARDLLTSLQQI